LRNAKTKDFWSGMKIKVLSSLDLGYATYSYSYSYIPNASTFYFR
jgi:hypothetical protein